MKLMLCFSLFLTFAIQGVAQNKAWKLQEGDLLFCISANENQITQVTQGAEGQAIDHVGIVHLRGDSVFVLEAIHQGVVLTPMDSFLLRRDSLVLASRLVDTIGVSRSVQRALQYLGKPYDFEFMPSDSAFYCSELVQKNYLDDHNQLVFQPIPMSFHDKTGKVTQFWKDYYARRGMQVPEGKPGSNPGALSRSRKLRFLFRFF